MPSWNRTSDAATEPITTAKAKKHLNVDFSDDDTFIEEMITSARQHAEQYTGRSFITQTWVRMLDRFPRVIELEWGDVISITTLKYIDTDGNLQTLASDQYQTDFTANPARVMPARTVNWPTISSLDFNAVQVTYTAGYGAASAVPQVIKNGITIIVAHLSGFGREVATDIRLQTVPLGAYDLLSSYRFPGLG